MSENVDGIEFEFEVDRRVTVRETWVLTAPADSTRRDLLEHVKLAHTHIVSGNGYTVHEDIVDSEDDAVFVRTIKTIPNPLLGVPHERHD